MSLSNSNSGFSHSDELEKSGLLDSAIANACERRNIAVSQNDLISELLDEEAEAVMGGLSTSSVCVPGIRIRPFPPNTVGFIYQDPKSLPSYDSKQ